MKPTTDPFSPAAFGVAAEFPRPGPVARVLLALLRGYKLVLSPLVGSTCRFLPSCSDYMAEAIRRHGALGGVVLGLGRLGRCQPFCPGGHDPVPDRLPRWLRGRDRRPFGAAFR